MNFDRTGWLRRYAAFRTAAPLAHSLPSTGVRVLEDTGVHHELDQAIYYFLQPTGLLYGFPVAAPFPELEYPGARFHDTAGRAQLVFVEALFACLVADRHYFLQDLAPEPDHFPPALHTAVDYFSHAATARAAPRSLWPRAPVLWRPRGAEGRFERAVDRRIRHSGAPLNLTGTYYNSFLFLDLYYCLLWQRRILVEPERREQHLHDLTAQQTRLRGEMLRLMIAAAHVSGEVVAAERRLIQWFLRSSGLPRSRQHELRGELARGVALSTVRFPEAPWLVRRFILEALLMTMLVDRDLSPDEQQFLAQVVDRLELWEEELSQSVIALEVFILRQEGNLPVLRDRSFVRNVGDHLRGQATVVIRKNLHRIVTEIRETQELYTLLMKATHLPLTPEEKRKVREQLMDILKTIPAVAIWALPGGGFVLPILIKLLPFNLLPSSFED